MVQEKPSIGQGERHHPAGVAGARIEERRVVEHAPPSARLAGGCLP
jgi:hypothetical protein